MSFRGAVQLPPYGVVLNGTSGMLPGVFDAWSGTQAKLSQLYLARSVAFTRIRYGVQTSLGNIDIGIYDTGFQRLYSTGSLAVPAAGPVEVNLSPAIWTLTSGLYYLACACSAAAAIYGNSESGFNDTLSVASLAASFPLPASLAGATFNRGGSPILMLVEAGN